MPCDRFSFAVLVSRKDYLIRFLCKRAQIGHHRRGFCGDYIAGGEVMRNINADLAFGEIADVTVR